MCVVRTDCCVTAIELDFMLRFCFWKTSLDLSLAYAIVDVTVADKNLEVHCRL